MSYKSIIDENRAGIDGTFEKLDNKLSRIAKKSRHKIPYTTVNGEHDDKRGSIDWWTNGFFGGLMWLMYEATKNEEYRITAEQSEMYLDEALENVEKLHHDVGFMWHLTSTASYRLTGNKKSKNRALIAAMSLASRYNIDGGFIRAWNESVVDVSGWTIIDCMMNIPLLYWASEEIGDKRFTRIALRHADMGMRDHVRSDGSVNHIVVHDTERADTVIETNAGQGYAVGSSWSRGCGWALYGFALSYIHTGERRYLDTAIKVAEHVIAETEKTAWLPRCDFRQPATPVYYDSTAGAICACGLIEIARALDGEEKEKYLSAALNILKAMEKEWCDYSDCEDSILQMGTEDYKMGHHMPIIYGDFFFTEAILKLRGSDFLIW